jgi:hypothetical protein
LPPKSVKNKPLTSRSRGHVNSRSHSSVNGDEENEPSLTQEGSRVRWGKVHGETLKEERVARASKRQK